MMNLNFPISFEHAICFALQNEKGIEDRPNDKGGITNFGISLRFLKSISSENLKNYGIFDEVTEETIRSLDLERVKKIYYDEFWIHAPFDKIMIQEQVNYIFDMAINMGISPAIKCVQRACWSVRRKRDIVDDGILGENTIKAINMCGFLLMSALRSERAGFYRLIVQTEVDQKDFLNGWLNRAYEIK